MCGLNPNGCFRGLSPKSSKTNWHESTSSSANSCQLDIWEFRASATSCSCLCVCACVWIYWCDIRAVLTKNDICNYNNKDIIVISCYEWQHPTQTKTTTVILRTMKSQWVNQKPFNLLTWGETVVIIDLCGHWYRYSYTYAVVIVPGKKKCHRC